MILTQNLKNLVCFSIVIVLGISQKINAQIIAYPDNFNLLYQNATSTVSLITNDLNNNNAATSATVTATGVTIPAGFTLNANGTIAVAQSVVPGTYQITYKICQVASPTTCSSNATSTVKVVGYKGNVGINTSDPTANFHVKGTLRFENGSQSNNALMRVFPDGSMRWQYVPKPDPVFGVMDTEAGVNLNGTSSTPIYAKAHITLPFGKWVVRNRITLARSDNDSNWTGGGTPPDDGAGFWVSSYLSDSSTNSTPTADIAATQSSQISGTVLMPSYYGNLGGGIVIDNKTPSKQYFFWVKATRYNSTNGQVVGLYGYRWSENFIMAIPLY